MEEQYTTPRFICKSIMKHEDGWMVTYPDYERAGENPYSVRESTRVLDSQDLMEWVERRVVRLGGVLAKPLEEKDAIVLDHVVPIPVTQYTPTGAKARTTSKMKKLKCGHLTPRRKGTYPKRCPDCRKVYEERLKQLVKEQTKLIKRKLK